MWANIVHGGGNDLDPSEHGDNRKGCLVGLEFGRSILGQGGSTIVAVDAAFRLETDPASNTGYGNALAAAVRQALALVGALETEAGAIARTAEGTTHCDRNSLEFAVACGSSETPEAGVNLRKSEETL